MPSVPYQIDDAKTDAVAVSGKWRTLLPTDATPALLSDLGGAHQGGSFAIAANASPRRAAFNVATTPNTTVEGDRYIDVEIYDVLPAGTSLTVGKVRTKIVEDDVANSNVFGPISTGDTGSPRLAGGANGYRLSGTVKNTGWRVEVMGSTAAGTGCYFLTGKTSDGSVNPTAVTGYYQGDTGSPVLDNNLIAAPTPNTTNGQLLVCEVSKTGLLVLTIGGTQIFSNKVFGNGLSDTANNQHVRFVTNGAASPDVTLTALSA